MDLKMRLQRVLQIVEESEGVAALSDLERDIILAELRELYSEVKFGVATHENSCDKSIVAPIAEPVVSVEPVAEPIIEPVVSVEPVAEPVVEPVAEPVLEPVAEPVVEPAVELVEEPAVEEPVVAAVEKEEKISTLHSPLSTPKRSPLLSLYEDAPTPVVGEQFCEKQSVADSIACPKGVAESTPVASLRAAIGVADRFLLINELFAGDSNAYESAIEVLDAQPSLDDCVIYISENYSWRANAEGTKLIMTLLQRKYNE